MNHNRQQPENTPFSDIETIPEQHTPHPNRDIPHVRDRNTSSSTDPVAVPSDSTDLATTASPDLAAWTRAVLAAFWQAEHPLTRDELVACLGESREAVDAAIESLDASGLITWQLAEG